MRSTSGVSSLLACYCTHACVSGPVCARHARGTGAHVCKLRSRGYMILWSTLRACLPRRQPAQAAARWREPPAAHGSFPQCAIDRSCRVRNSLVNVQFHSRVCACGRARGPRNVCVRACVRQCAFVCENGCVRHLEALLGASAATAESQTKLRTSGISAAASTTTTLPSEPGHLPASAAVRVSARRVRMRS